MDIETLERQIRLVYFEIEEDRRRVPMLKYELEDCQLAAGVLRDGTVMHYNNQKRLEEIEDEFSKLRDKERWLQVLRVQHAMTRAKEQEEKTKEETQS